VVLNSDRLNERAGKRERMPPSGKHLLCASKVRGGRRKKGGWVVVDGLDADLADLIEIVRAAARDPVAADWVGLQERYHSGFLDMP
jgi:hypothetical protein